MNKFQLEVVQAGICSATDAIDKALSALSANARKPDPLLVAMAIDYIVASRRHLHNAKSFAFWGNEESAHEQA